MDWVSRHKLMEEGETRTEDNIRKYCAKSAVLHDAELDHFLNYPALNIQETSKSCKSLDVHYFTFEEIEKNTITISLPSFLTFFPQR